MAQRVTARFYVAEVGLTAGGAGKIRLSASTKGDYSSWSKWTPAGSVDITCLNDEATEFFRLRLGKDVALDFTDAPEPAGS